MNFGLFASFLNMLGRRFAMGLNIGQGEPVDNTEGALVTDSGVFLTTDAGSHIAHS